MDLLTQWRRIWRSPGWSLRQTMVGSPAKWVYSSRRKRSRYLAEQLEQRVLLSVMTLTGTSGNDTIVFQQTDATHDTFTLNGTPTTFSTAGITSISINSLAGTDSITVLSNNSGIPLTVMGSGADTVNVGNAGSVQGILGTLTLSGTTGQMALIVDDSTDPALISATISSTEIAGLAPAAIDYTAGQLASITVKGGTGGSVVPLNTFDITSTNPATPVTFVGGGNHTLLIGPDQNETWTMNGQSAGSVSNMTFSNVGQVMGGSGDDKFVLSKNSLYGRIDGGAGNNTLVSASGTGASWSIQDTNAGIMDNAAFGNIQNLTGGNTTTGFDTFNFEGGTVTGLIDGGGGRALITGFNRNLGGSITGVDSGTFNGASFQKIPDINAGSGSTFTFGTAGVIHSISCIGTNNTIIGANQTNAWHITDGGAGTINGINPFSGIQNFVGGTGSDTFNFADSAAVSGSFDGGAGTDTLIATNVANSWIISSANGGSLNGASFSHMENLTGGTVADTFSFSSTGSQSGNIVGGGGADTLNGGGVANAWSITSGNSGTVNGTNFSGIQQLGGSTVSDTFAFQPSGFVTGSVNGGGGAETLDYSSRSSGIVVNLATGAATAVGAGITNITGLVGSTGSDTLTGPNGVNAWNITGVNTGTLNSTFSFSGIENLIGGTGADTFTYSSGGSLGGPIRGGGGSNTLVGANIPNTWVISSASAGTLNGAAFSDIESLTGGSSTDSFAFQPSGSVSGSVNGGGGTGTLDYSSRSLAIVVNFATNTATAIGGTISNITSVIGSSGIDTLTGANSTNTFSITGANSGTINGAVSFSGIENLTGGSANDTFAFASGGSISGLVRGGGGTNTLDYSALNTAVVVDLSNGVATGTGGVSAIQNVIGSAGNDTITAAAGGSVITTTGNGSNTLIGGPGNDTFILSPTTGAGTTVDGRGGNNSLVGPNVANTWSITGGNAGSLNGSAFQNIQNLAGGTASDLFAFNPSGFIAGSVNGGGGGDTLDYSSRVLGIVVNLQTSSATAIGGGFSKINSLIGSIGSDTLTGANSTNTWSVTGANSGTVNGAFSFSGIENLTGGTANDTFAFASGGSISGLVRGGGGTDTLDYSALSTSVFVDLSNGVAANTGGVSAIQNVIGSTGSDTITAADGGSVITTTGSGSNTLIGGPGDDRFILSPTTGAGTTVDGRGGNNTLVGPNVANTWNITSGNAGTLNGSAFHNIQNLTGGTSADSFAFNPSGFMSGSVNGGGGTNTLDYSSRSSGIVVNLQLNSATAIGGGFSNITSVIGSTGSDDNVTGANAVNTWNITGANTGTLNGLTFSGIENLTGGTTSDAFAFGTGGSVSGLVSGGGGTNTLDYSALSTDVVVDLANSVAARTGGVLAIQNVIGSTGNDTITASADGSMITTTGSGNNTLIGGAGNDTFILSATTGAGTTVDGRGGTNTLGGSNVANTWSITSGNAGTLNGSAFHNIQNLMGGSAADSFAFNPSGFVSGSVNGLGGSDTLDYSSRSSGIVVNLQTGSASAIGGVVTSVENVIGTTSDDTIRSAVSGGVITANGGNDNLLGDAGNDTFVLSNSQGSSTTVNGISGNDTLIGPNIDSIWNITASNAGTVNGIPFSNIQNVTGGTGLNHFYMGVNGSLAGTLDGGSPTSDWLDYSAWYPQKSFVNLATGTASNLGAVMNIQNVRGSSFGGSLTGNSVGNILIGGQYSDTAIQGGSERSLLLSGFPLNTINGGSGNDIIIGKSTTYDSSSLANDTALASILAEWQSANSYSTRIAHINGTTPGGLNGTNYLIFGTTVIPSPGMSILTGAAGGMNWYFAGVHDVITDLQPGEQVN